MKENFSNKIAIFHDLLEKRNMDIKSLQSKEKSNGNKTEEPSLVIIPS